MGSVPAALKGDVHSSQGHRPGSGLLLQLADPMCPALAQHPKGGLRGSQASAATLHPQRRIGVTLEAVKLYVNKLPPAFSWRQEEHRALLGQGPSTSKQGRALGPPAASFQAPLRAG